MGRADGNEDAATATLTQTGTLVCRIIVRRSTSLCLDPRAHSDTRADVSLWAARGCVDLVRLLRGLSREQDGTGPRINVTGIFPLHSLLQQVPCQCLH